MPPARLCVRANVALTICTSEAQIGRPLPIRGALPRLRCSIRRVSEEGRDTAAQGSRPGRPAASRVPRVRQQPTSVPIYQTATFASADADELADAAADARAGSAYSRIANPTSSALGAAYAELAGGEAGVSPRRAWARSTRRVAARGRGPGRRAARRLWLDTDPARGHVHQVRCHRRLRGPDRQRRCRRGHRRRADAGRLRWRPSPIPRPS